LQTLRIAIHRRKGATLKFLFIVVLFFGGCFTLFKDTEVILPAIVTAGALYWFSLHPLMLSVSGFGTSRHFVPLPNLAALGA